MNCLQWETPVCALARPYNAHSRPVQLRGKSETIPELQQAFVITKPDNNKQLTNTASGDLMLIIKNNVFLI